MGAAKIDMMESASIGYDDDKDSILSEIKNINPSFKEIIKETLMASAEDVNIGGVSIDDWDRTGWAIPIVCLYYGVFTMAFFYFVYTLTLQGISITYLSLHPSNSDQLCIEIPVTISTSVQGDAFGNWDTNLTFFQNSSVFVLRFTGCRVTNDQYRSIMLGFKDDLKHLSEKSSRRDAAWNAVMWSTFEFSDNHMNFYSSADARYLYNGDVRSGIVSSASGGICYNPQQYGKIDPTGRYLVFSVPTSVVSSTTLNGDFSYDPKRYVDPGYANGLKGYDIIDTCPKQFPATLWQSWSLSVYTGNLEVGFDLRTMACVMSINMGITKLSAYTQTSSIYGTVGTGGIPGFFYYDRFYDEMHPFFCVDKQSLHDQGVYILTDAQINGPDLCFLVQQTLHAEDPLAPLLYYPISQSLTESLTTHEIVHCGCPSHASDPNCNKKQLVMGLFYDKDLKTSYFDVETNTYIENKPINQIKFALSVQQFLIDDPIDGDLKMQEHFTDFFISGLELSGYFGYFDNQSYPYHNETFLREAGLPKNATYHDLHKYRWNQICPWGTCGSFIFQISSDETVDAFLQMNNHFYQAGLAPFLNSTFNVTKVVGVGPILDHYYYNDTQYAITDDPPTRCDFYNITTGYCTNRDDIYSNIVFRRQMCENTVYNSAIMDSFIENSPVAVIQPYYECHHTVHGALHNSVGNAAGTAGMVSGIFMLIAGILFRKLQNRRAAAHALKVAKAERDIELNGGESTLKHKIGVMTVRQKEQIDGKIDEKMMAAMFVTMKSVVKLAKDQQDTLLNQQDTILYLQKRKIGHDTPLDDERHSQESPEMGLTGEEGVVPSLRSTKEVASLTDLQVNFKKLTDIVEFDFNDSHLTNLSTSSKSLLSTSGKSLTSSSAKTLISTSAESDTSFAGKSDIRRRRSKQ